MFKGELKFFGTAESDNVNIDMYKPIYLHTKSGENLQNIILKNSSTAGF